MKWRWVPVEHPVVPMMPISWPQATCAPTDELPENLSMCKYDERMPLSCVSVIELPFELSHLGHVPAEGEYVHCPDEVVRPVILPLAEATMGTLRPHEISRPLWT